VFRQTARVYDLIYEASGKDYGAESAVIDAIVQQRNPGARTLLDVACGTGGHLRHLQHSYDVTGVDLDPEMLQEARRHLPTTRLIQADMRTFRLNARFDAVICLFSSIGYMRDVDELDQAVSTMARHVTPRGVLVVDGWVRPEAWRDGDPTHLDVAANETTKVARVGLTRRDGARTRLELHHLVGTADGIEHLVDVHELTLFAPEAYEAAFRRAGLVVEVVESPMADRDRYIGVRSD
jgi:dTDP-3-amino-3,6-dideoxy-alpha-D-glucopyranose N,N-dimethyltransferase/dTDP-3-amino-3,4,6-trideoxy-alpha-D-glucopyranose N,N-dimethyltransferase/N-methyltransferase